MPFLFKQIKPMHYNQSRINFKYFVLLKGNIKMYVYKINKYAFLLPRQVV